MNCLNKIAFAATLLAVVLSSQAAQAAEPAVVDAFTSAPASVIPLLPHATRLDMLDYFNSGMTTSSNNLMNGKSRITQLTDRYINIDLTPASTLQLVVLPAANKEYTAVISTIATPSPDSRMTIYSSDWQQTLTDKLFRTPQLKDWLTPEGKKKADEIEMLLPFMLVSYTYDPTTQKLTLTNNSSSFLAREVYEDIKPYLVDSISYIWNGKKFETVK